jgi:hypothetical protein
MRLRGPTKHYSKDLRGRLYTGMRVKSKHFVRERTLHVILAYRPVGTPQRAQNAAKPDVGSSLYRTGLKVPPDVLFRADKVIR